MTDSKQPTSVSLSVKFPNVIKEGKDKLSGDEFEALFQLSGETSKTTFIHKALRHYADEVHRQLKEEAAAVANRASQLEKLFPSK